ncbi:DUF6197 family protein [Streptomyces nojiriensis]|uniref:DUF6197 family protein n=1 Tax=Streptomyces nojiriensis TaxID=66374 RepID=UPI001AD60B1A|nr:Bifunctional NMN adenylyltransferase/Nudix hydrolase [Streptomyces nojiriensis]
MTETMPETIRYTADVVCIRGGDVLVIERGWPPHQGRLALPGGHVDAGETSREAAARELLEETCVHVPADSLVLVGVYDAPERDPRGRYVTVTRAAAPLVHRPGPVEKTLTDALAFLDTHGWAKHRLIHPEGARCSIGALRAAAGTRNAAYRDAGNLLLAEACRQHGKQWEAIPAWNDNHAGAQVRGVWEAAIQRAHHMNI